MKQINWQLISDEVRKLYPNLIQLATYSRNRWILIFGVEADNFLATFSPLAALVKKHKLQVPLIVSTEFISKSLDSYPLEFLDIQTDYTSLYAKEDVIATLQFGKDDIRLQIERELKGKWLLTRLIALEKSNNQKHLFLVLKDSFHSLLPVFKGFCCLNGISAPRDTEKLLDCLSDILHTEVKVLSLIAKQEKAPSRELQNTLFADYIRLLRLSADVIDNWKPAPVQDDPNPTLAAV